MNLLKALVILRDTYKVKKQLIFTGYKHAHIKNYKIIRNFITNEKLDNQVKILGYIPQEDMPYIYSNAHFLVYPSLFEGFGIPLIEAMRTNIPIVCSNAGSIPEIVEESALIFNPYDPENIAIKMLEISQTEKRKELIEKGKIQAQKFSWKNSAEQTLVLFHQLLHKR
ncbi:glycosyltransferase family 4 protein [Bacillus megaterium NBRC 15308 = ATCC 14581]|nr:glycosyltransferase family 4 protein [Priestia megaterium NBRC 15308 = ATCC 14581]